MALRIAACQWTLAISSCGPLRCCNRQSEKPETERTTVSGRGRLCTRCAMQAHDAGGGCGHNRLLCGWATPSPLPCGPVGASPPARRPGGPRRCKSSKRSLLRRRLKLHLAPCPRMLCRCSRLPSLKAGACIHLYSSACCFAQFEQDSQRSQHAARSLVHINCAGCTSAPSPPARLSRTARPGNRTAAWRWPAHRVPARIDTAVGGLVGEGIF
jgi:hypothetical protein